jgi:TRAP-type C4-dicarboxylate transport system permease small subunit
MDEQKAKTSSVMRVYEISCGVLLLLGALLANLEILGRVIFNISYDFIIDCTVWLTIWATLFMGGPLLLSAGHVSIDLVRDKLTGTPRLILQILNDLAILAYGITVAVGGFIVLFRHFTEYSVYPRYFPIPKWWVEICIPSAMSIFAICALMLLIRDIRRKW